MTELVNEYRKVQTQASEAFQLKDSADSRLAELRRDCESLVQQVLEGKSENYAEAIRVCLEVQRAGEDARTKGMEWFRLSQSVAKLGQQIVSAQGGQRG